MLTHYFTVYAFIKRKQTSALYFCINSEVGEILILIIYKLNKEIWKESNSIYKQALLQSQDLMLIL